MIRTTLPAQAGPLLLALAPAFTAPTFTRFQTLLAAAVRTTGRRTIAQLLRTTGPLAGEHRARYQRLLSSARVDLYRCAQDHRQRRRPHRAPAQLRCRLLRRLLLRFPQRALVFVGDAGCGTPEVARFVHRHRTRLALVRKLHPDAHRFEPPPPYTGKGRPRVKGKPLPKPRHAIQQRRRLRRLTVGWYGGGTRPVGTAGGVGHGYKSGRGLVP